MYLLTFPGNWKQNPPAKDHFHFSIVPGFSTYLGVEVFLTIVVFNVDAMFWPLKKFWWAVQFSHKMCLKSHKFSALEFAQSFPKHYFLPLEACETSHLCKCIFLTSNLENYGNKILLLLQIVKRDQIRKKGQYNSTA